MKGRTLLSDAARSRGHTAQFLPVSFKRLLCSRQSQGVMKKAMLANDAD